ncbi:MAG: hypothetical protein U0359_36745 [Byssovorax sp.]
MNDDVLLERLREVVREEDPLRDPALIALLDGQATEGERAALEERAKSSPEIRAILDACRPLDDAARERILGRVPVPTLEIDRPVVPVRQRSSHWRKQLTGLVTIGGLALGAYGYLATRTISAGDQWTLHGQGELRTRGDEQQAEVVKLGPGSRLTLTLSPARDVDISLDARAFLVKDGQAQRWEVPIDLKPTGAVSIAGTKEQVFPGVAPGRWEMVVVVGRPFTLPSASTIAALSRDRYRTESSSYRVYVKPIELRDTPEP